MEEKKPVKISLAAFVVILLAVSIIIVAVMEFFILKLKDEKQTALNKVDSLTNEVSSLQNSVNELQGTINSVSNIVNDNTSNSTSEKTTNTNTSTPTKDEISFSDETIKKSFQKYFNMCGAYEAGPVNLLKEIGLLNENNTGGKSIEIDGTSYIKTNIKPSEFKSTMLKYVSEKCLEKEFSNNYIFKDTLYYLDGGATGLNYKVNSITKISDTEYTAKCDDIAMSGNKDPFTCKFTITKNDVGKCVIDSCKIIK